MRNLIGLAADQNRCNSGANFRASDLPELAFTLWYFHLTKQKMDIKDGTTKVTFKYEPSGTAYSVFALNLYEQSVVQLIPKNGKILFRS